MKDKKSQIIFIIVFIIIFFAVDILGFFWTPANYTYYHFDQDVDVYFTYMDQAREGRFWFCNQYAVEEHACKLFFPLWFVSGYFGEIINLSNATVFNLTKLVLILILSYLFYLFCQKLFIKHGFFVFVLGIVSGGVFFEYWHANIFVSTLRNPLNLLVLIIYLILVWLIINVLNKKLILKTALALILVNWLLVMLHPYQALFLIINYGIFILLNSLISFRKLLESFKIIFTCLLGVSAGLLYYVLLFISNTAYSDWLLNNKLPIYSFGSIITAFGLLLPFSLIGCYLIVKNNFFKNEWIILVSLTLGGFATLFLPLYVNNKLFLGWYLGLFFTSAYLIVYIINNRFFGQFKKIMLFLIILMLTSGNVIYFVDDFNDIFINKFPYYLPKNYFLSANWLKENSTLDDSVLTIDTWNTFYVGQAGLKGFVGSNQVFQRQKKIELSRWFYKNNDQDQEKRDMLNNYGLDFVLFSAFEKEKGSYDPSTKEYLEKVYDDGWAQIYKVIPQA